MYDEGKNKKKSEWDNAHFNKLHEIKQLFGETRISFLLAAEYVMFDNIRVQYFSVATMAILFKIVSSDTVIHFLKSFGIF